MKQVLKKTTVYKALKRPESDAIPDSMEKLGINNITRLAKKYNHLSNGRFFDYRKRIVGELFSSPPPFRMGDGWAMDESRSLPLLGKLLSDADDYIERRHAEGVDPSRKGFLRDMVRPGDLEANPTFLDFVTTPEVLSVVADYLGCAPVLSDIVPPGVRLTESDIKNDPSPGGPPRQSQLYHRDIHDDPVVYIIVLLRDTTMESGPFTWLGAKTSDEATRKLKYGERGRPFRITDEEMFSVIGKSEEHIFAYPRGTVLFIDSGRCFHFGSRNCVVPRYQFMYAFTTPCRTDFAEFFTPRKKYPQNPADSRARRLALDRTCME